jgi:hypothetical protein
MTPIKKAVMRKRELELLPIVHHEMYRAQLLTNDILHNTRLVLHEARNRIINEFGYYYE